MLAYESRQILDFSMKINIEGLLCVCSQINDNKPSTKVHPPEKASHVGDTQSNEALAPG